MNAMSSPPPPDPGYWFSIADHIEAIIAGVGATVLTASAAIWRIASWTTGIRGEMAAMREEASDWRQAVFDKLDDMKEANEKAHDGTKREMDQLRQAVRDDREETRAMRQETREATAGLSARIDNVIARRS